MNRTQTIDGARVTIEDVRAGEGFVIIDFGVQDLRDDRRSATGEPSALADNPPEALPPHYGRLTDEAGKYFSLVRASMEEAGPANSLEARRAPKANSAVFAPPENLQPGTSRRLRFQFSLEQLPIPSSREGPAEETGGRAPGGRGRPSGRSSSTSRSPCVASRLSRSAGRPRRTG